MAKTITDFLISLWIDVLLVGGLCALAVQGTNELQLLKRRDPAASPTTITLIAAGMLILGAIFFYRWW